MKHIVHNIWFRLFSPLITGVIMYLLVLMFFNSLNQLSTTFFGQELILSISISYVVYFALRQLSVIVEAFIPFEVNPVRRMIAQYSGGVVLSGLLVWAIIAAYFSYILRYSNYTREASIFITLFVVMSLVYNSLYFSILYLNKQNREALEREEDMKKQLVNELSGLLRDTRPELFNLGMEALIVQLRKNKKEADKYITVFSKVYRYNLHSRKNELVNLRDELENLNYLLFILNSKYENNIKLITDINKEALDHQVLPTSLQILTEVSVFSSIIGMDSPLEIKLNTSSNNELIFRHNGIGALKESHLKNDIKYLSDSQKYFTGKPLIKEEKLKETIYRLPLIKDEIDSLE